MHFCLPITFLGPIMHPIQLLIHIVRLTSMNFPQNIVLNIFTYILPSNGLRFTQTHKIIGKFCVLCICNSGFWKMEAMVTNNEYFQNSENVCKSRNHVIGFMGQMGPLGGKFQTPAVHDHYFLTFRTVS